MICDTAKLYVFINSVLNLELLSMYMVFGTHWYVSVCMYVYCVCICIYHMYVWHCMHVCILFVRIYLWMNVCMYVHMWRSYVMLRYMHMQCTLGVFITMRFHLFFVCCASGPGASRLPQFQHRIQSRKHISQRSTDPWTIWGNGIQPMYLEHDLIFG